MASEGEQYMPWNSLIIQKNFHQLQELMEVRE